MTLLIGLHGKARSGKDTFARSLMGFQPFVRMAFADPLKTAVSGLFNIPQQRAFSDDKDQLLEYWGLTLRDVLQRFGTEAMRDNFGADFWINRWESEYHDLKKNFSVVITDVRFPNEASRIRSLGGVIVHIRRDGAGLEGSAGSHISEQVLPFERDDFVINNNGSLDDLVNQAAELLSYATATTE